MPRALAAPHPFLCPGLSGWVCGPAHEGSRLTVAADMTCPPRGQASFPIGVFGDTIQGEHLAELALRVVALLAKPVRHTQHLLPAPSTLPGSASGQAPAGGLVFTFLM